ncbi:GntR family transcriptional regulator [Aestuariibacter halophilus]|uniref:GntR family transcriptional regulator n=1 Tax=Fluctibacter halophilus TaxID=226011 RepID=A0ABS8G3D9_9ALTE|nr:GntR family transcriptional regulator [Aestuariibacter halophilus]MCC2615004.1 GntR family transcriptional regulator [Aestuariibacter halophilus]
MAIQHKTRTQLVVEAIRERILKGEIAPGEPLRQAALAEALEVSRIPVREALVQLEAEGLVQFEAHKGATVSELSLEQIDEAFELRALLEAELLRRSIGHLNADDFARAEALMADMDAALSKGDMITATGELNIAFHNVLYARAERPQTQELVDALNKNCQRFVRLHISLAGGLDIASNEHKELLTLCKAGEKTKAVNFLKRHILGARDDIKAFLSKQEQQLA